MSTHDSALRDALAHTAQAVATGADYWSMEELGNRIAGAQINGPPAPTLAQVSALQAEVETLKRTLNEAIVEVDPPLTDGVWSGSLAEAIRAERTASQALAERARAERDAAVEALKQAANLCESEVQGVTLSTFIVNGVKIRDDQGQDRFLSTLEVSRYLRNLAHRIRARSAVTETKEGSGHAR